jgi:protein-L-isoaspartate(D-aspartate) O-methyltransferase
LRLAEGVDLHVDAGDLRDESALSQVLTHPAHEQWTGIRIHDGDPVAHLDLWLATTSGIGFAKLVAAATARQRGLVDPAWRWGGASLYDAGTLAYLAFRPLGDELAELGVIAHGPDSPKLTAHISDLLHQWNRSRPAEPVITAHRVGAPEDGIAPGTRVVRPETVLTVAWHPGLPRLRLSPGPPGAGA